MQIVLFCRYAQNSAEGCFKWLTGYYSLNNLLTLIGIIWTDGSREMDLVELMWNNEVRCCLYNRVARFLIVLHITRDPPSRGISNRSLAVRSKGGPSWLFGLECACSSILKKRHVTCFVTIRCHSNSVYVHLKIIWWWEWRFSESCELWRVLCLWRTFVVRDCRETAQITLTL